MRKLILVLLVLLAVSAALIGLAALRLNAYLDSNRAWLEAQAESAIGRPVHFDALRVAWRGGLAVEVDNLRVADDPAASQDDFLRAAQAEIVLRILPALFGRYEIGHIILDQPALTVVHNGRGLSTDSLAAAGARPPSERPSAAAAATTLLISAVEVRNGSVHFIDRTQTPPAELMVRRIQLELANVGLTSPIRVDLSAAVLADSGSDLSVSGTVGPVQTAAADAWTGVPLDLDLQAGPVAITALQRLPWLAQANSPALASAGPISVRTKLTGSPATLSTNGSVQLGATSIGFESKTESLSPFTAALVVRADELRPAALGPAGARTTDALRGVEARGTLALEGSAPSFVGTVQSAEGSLQNVSYQNLTADVQLSDTEIHVTRYQVRALGGTSDGGADYDLRNPARPGFHVRPAVHGFSVADLLALSLSKDTPTMRGRLEASADLRGAGGDWPAIAPTLTGTTRVNIQDGVLVGVNLVDQVLTAVGAAPGLTDLVSPQIRAKYPGIFSSGDTRFETLRGSARLADSRATTDDLTLATRDYSLRAKGWLSLDNRLDLDATLIISPGLAADLIASVKQLQVLAESDGRIEVPFKLRGKMRKPHVILDPAFITRTVTRALQSDVTTLFGKKKRRDKPAANATPRPEVDLLQKGLQNLFRH